MDILATIEHKGEFYFAILVLIACVLFVLTWFIYEIKCWIQQRDKYKSFGFLFFTLVATVVFAYMTVAIYKIGPLTEYKALITDFNEVYENGYTVVDQEGEIYILEKMKD